MLCGAALAAAVLLASPIPRALAQADSGSIVGAVTDVSGAAISGANVTLVNGATGFKLTGTSNSSGELNIPAVPRGTYLATVTAPGFQTQTESVTVTVTTSLTLEFKLAPGETTTSVQVSGAATLVDTSDPSLGETIEGKQITQLPLNGRNALNLALLTPGVTQGAYGEPGNDPANRNGESGGSALSVNGIRPQANNFLLDGVDNNDGLQNIVLFFPNVEATQEFKVSTSIAPAQYGRAGGALVIASTRSGTNSIHGAAFEFYRSGKFDSNPNYQFLGAPATPNPAYNRNQFGGALGMPILKNKLFLFGDYSGLRESLPGNASYITVPTALMRQGNFTELLNPATTYNAFDTLYPACYPNAATLNNNPAANSKGQIFDPQTCAPFTGNIIPQGRLNTAAVNYLNAFPAPTRTDRVLQNYLSQQQSAIKYNTFDTRLDWTPTAADQFFFRFSYDNSVNGTTSQLGLSLPNNGGTSYVHARGYDLGYTRVISPTMVNEARIAYNRDNYGYQPPNYGENISANLGIVNANRNQETTGGALIGGSNDQLEYSGDYGLFAVPQNMIEVTDTLNFQLGKHSVHAGGTFLRRQVNFFRPIDGKGFFAIAYHGSDFTGFEDSELLVGGVDNYGIGAQNGYFGEVSQEDGLFAQDDWRVNSRLTLNLGIRWDLLTWPYEMHNQQAAFDIQNGTVLLAGQNGVPRAIRNQNPLNFAPRVGFAYALDAAGRSALHGGYGIFYFPDYGGISNQLGQQPPFGGSATYYARNGYCITFTGQTSVGAPFTCPGYTSGTAAVTPLPAPGFPNFNPLAPPQGIGGLAVNRDDKHSRMQEYNLQLQQQFGKNDVVSIAYVGTHGDRLSTYYTYNQYNFGTTALPFPNLGGISYNAYQGISWYNGLQTHLEHRQGNALLTASYTWSHSLDNSPDAFGAGSVVSSAQDPMLEYGNSLQDQRHIFAGSAVYNFPFGRGEKYGANVNHAVDLAIGGWQANLIGLFQSGQPFDISTGVNSPGNRPDLVKPINYPKQISGHWFDPTSFSDNIPLQSVSGTGVYTRVGTLGRDQLYGPGYRSINLGLQKNLHLTERFTMELHGDAFNVLNTPQFTNPSASVTGSNFGQVVGTRSNSNRQIQLASRLTF
ncbi:carboxypeptidase regulatory-like domain-containing protein [Acidipila sp. EB88]|nr:carboxypeptidase regulatory-like domain-containing protein [Acidipila sp. EB88]